MDKIWDGNLSRSKVIGRCGGYGKQWMTTQNRQNWMQFFFQKIS